MSIYYGLVPCQKPNCTNKGYWNVSGNIYCGVHSRNQPRIQLPKPSLTIRNDILNSKFQQEKMEIEKARQQNLTLNQKGQVRVTKMLMMKDPASIPGFQKVFPNYKHQNRKDGLGMASLSPKSLGPILHPQPNLPPAKNLENFHQGSKVFQEEVDQNGNPSKLFFRNQKAFFEDPVPHRHKFKGTGKNPNIPLYFLWVDANHQQHRLSYIESRQFYCTYYQRLVASLDDFHKLQNLLLQGYNLQIIGYDGREVEKDKIEQEYLDDHAPFGHELVLYSMLVLDPKEYPWTKYKTFDF